MRDTGFMERLALDRGVRFLLYPSPAGALYLLANDSCMKCILFSPVRKGIPVIEKSFTEGETPQSAPARAFLERYFRDPCSLQNPGITSTMVNARTVISLHYADSGLKPIDLDLGSFSINEITIYRALLKTGTGSTLSYGGLSANAGIPRGARYVGNAMAKNSFPILIPCHRVIRTDGSIGGYTGGTEKKQLLLEHEKSGIKHIGGAP